MDGSICHLSVRQRPKGEGRQMRGHFIAWVYSVCPGRFALGVAPAAVAVRDPPAAPLTA